MAKTQLLADLGENASVLPESPSDSSNRASEALKGKTAGAVSGVLSVAKFADESDRFMERANERHRLMERTKELHSKLSSIGLWDIMWSGGNLTLGDGKIRIMAIPTSGDYSIAFDGLMGPLKIRYDGSAINMTGKGFHEVPTLIEQVLSAIEKHGGNGKAAESVDGSDDIKEKAAFLTSSVMGLTGGGQGSLDFEISLNGKNVPCGLLPITDKVLRVIVDGTRLFEINDGNIRHMNGTEFDNAETEALFDAIFPKLAVSYETPKPEKKLRMVRDGQMMSDAKNGTISYDLVGFCDGEASEENGNVAFTILLHLSVMNPEGMDFRSLMETMTEDDESETDAERKAYENRVSSTVGRLVSARALSRKGDFLTSNVDFSRQA